MKRKLDEFILDKSLHVSVHPDYIRNDFDYSDGREVEERIFEILKKAKDTSIFSKELIDHINDWPTEYHFSPLRHNLLRHLNFKETDHILELGCGCGAITRQLGESGATVVAIEGSLNRAKSAAARCKDLPNVRVLSGNFQDIILERTFDYVTMIGVFEYCPVFFTEDEPEAACLKIVRDVLKPGGKLLLAIENRLGLKYFMGLEEDHTGIPFYGIQDFYNRHTAKTFGRLELKSLLEENDFRFIEFQYPFPDYKIPEIVFHERAFHEHEFKPAEIIRQLKSRDYSNTALPLFSENLVWPVIEKNKLIPDLSNSFLVIAGPENETSDSENHQLAVKYTCDRKKQYNVRTEFKCNRSGIIHVKRSSLLKIDDEIDHMLVHCLGYEPYYPGQTLDSKIDKIIIDNNFEGYIMCIRQWSDFIIKNGLKKVNEENIYSSLVLSEYIDCIPSNLIISSDGLIFIDREWKLMKDFTVIDVLLRFLIYEKNSTFINLHLKGKDSPYERLLNYLDIQIDEKTYKIFSTIYEDIYERVYGTRKAETLTAEKNRVMFKIEKRISKVKSLFHKIINNISRIN